MSNPNRHVVDLSHPSTRSIHAVLCPDGWLPFVHDHDQIAPLWKGDVFFKTADEAMDAGKEGARYLSSSEKYHRAKARKAQ